MSRNEAAVSYDDVTRKRKGDWSSQQVAFRHFNNYVKKSLIQFALDRLAASGATAGSSGAAVLDLASGRGGDVGKWVYSQSRTTTGPHGAQVGTTAYDCYDISPECIAEAQTRFAELANVTGKPPSCAASFAVADCFGDEFLTHTLPSSPLFGRYHVVSIQFAFHYACQSPELIRSVLTAVSAALAPGGVVLITTVDSDVLSRRAVANTLSNDLFRITFPAPPQFVPTEGGAQGVAPCTKYHFHLEGFVDCAEYVVGTEMVTSIAASLNLVVCDSVSKTFSAFVEEYATSWKLNKGNKLSPSEYELVTLYRSLCFEKRAA